MNGVFMSNGIILLNICGDVIYIIQQRLKAQNIDDEKAIVVLNDLSLTIYTQPFLQKIFNPLKTYTYQEVFKFVDQIVHCSIMKLGEESLQKLYDLVVMALKSYMMKSNSPFEIYLCTLNHFDTILQFGISDSAKQAIQQCRQMFVEKYSKLSSFDYLLIRGEILRYLQGRFTRVQMFLNDKSQNSDGTFVQKQYGLSGFGVEQPGCIIKIQNNEKYNVILLSSKYFQQNNEKSPFVGKSFLGDNIFANKENNNQNQIQNQHQNIQQTQKLNGQQTKELNQLAQLIQKPQITTQDDINLFYKPVTQNQQIIQNNEQNLQQQQQQQQKQQQGSNLIKQQIFQQFEINETIENQNDDDQEIDLLDLMDKAELK